MKILRYSILFSIGISILLASEISVFDAGNLDKESPYGLTKSEQIILDNKEMVGSLNRNINGIKSEVSEIKERIEGLQSVLESNNNRVREVEINTNILNQKFFSNGENNFDSLYEQVNNLKQEIQELKTKEAEDYKKISIILTELSSIIDSINVNYVSKSQINDLVKDKEKESTKKNTSVQSSKLMEDAVADFENNKFDDAQEKFEMLVKRNYMPARSSYYLGEISYNNKNWNNAIVYYKKSIQLYDKAAYVPKLLYHTAISFDKLSKPEEANKFYKTLKTNFPETREAKASPDR